MYTFCKSGLPVFDFPISLSFPSLSNTFQILEKAEHRKKMWHYLSRRIAAHTIQPEKTKQNGVGSGRAAHAGPSPEIPAAVARS